MRITDRAADEAGSILSLPPIEARALLASWIEAVVQRQDGKPQDSGLVAYRGPRPWQLILLVNRTDQAVVAVRSSTTTRLLQRANDKILDAGAADARRQAGAALAGRPVAPAFQPLDPRRKPNRNQQASPPQARVPDLVTVEAELTSRQHAWCRQVAELRGTTVAEWIRTLVADAMEDERS